MSIIASIDIGSNSVLLAICELDENKKILNELASLSFVTRLGHKLDEKLEFHPQSMDDTFKALKECCELIKKNGLRVEETRVAATEASRVATNAPVFFKKVEDQLGLRIEIITGEREAELTALGVCSAFSEVNNREAIIMDMGGASTEFMKVNFETKKVLQSISLPCGSVRATQWLEDQIWDQKMDELSLNTVLLPYREKNILAVSGTMLSAAAMCLDKKRFCSNEIEGITVSLSDFQKLLDKIEKLTLQQLETKYPFLGKRSYSIKGGIKAAVCFLKEIGREDILFSTRGLRHGLILT